MRLSPGSAVGPYEISAAIGAGGMGEVYRARDTRLGRDIALKVLPADVALDSGRLARFEREARMASALNHPNIVTIHDFARTGADCYLVMELIRGESLRAVLRSGAVPLRRLLDVACGIAEGLAAAHAAGIIHRDLKPENVMVTPEGVAKILDFGLVKATAEPADSSATLEKFTETGAIVGTTLYMSPEQIRGGTLDGSSDQFALGLILHEMATGRHPFRGDTAHETLTAILRDEPPPLDGTLPEPLVWIVDRCLAKEPAHRYASTADLARDLATVRARLSSGRIGRPAGAEAPPRRARRIVPVAVVTLLALLAGAAFFVAAPWRVAGPGAEPIHLHLATGKLQPHRGEVANPIEISPDGRYLLTQGAGERAMTELWITDLRTGEMRLLAEDGFGAAWSSDSSAVAYFADGKLKTQRIAGGPPTVVCDALPEGTVAWHGETILFVRYSGPPAGAGIYRVSSRGGKPELLVGVLADRLAGGLRWWPQFLPDGKRFISMTMTGPPGGGAIEHELTLGSLDGSPVKPIGMIDSRAVFAAGHLLYVRDGTLLAHRFDPDRVRLIGEPKPLVDDLHYFRSTGMAAFSVSKNGILAWRSASRPVRLVWVDRNGAEIETIATNLFDDHGRLSRDGSRYVVGVIDPKQGISDIWSYDLRRNNSERLTFELLDQKAPVPGNGETTIYYRTDGNRGPPDIFALSPGRKPALVHAGRGVEHPEDVSPDGRWLLFTTRLPASTDIWRLPLDPSGPPQPVVATPFNETSPRFSADGLWIAYASNLSGRDEIYIKPLEGDASAVRVSRTGGSLPRWSRDGRELYYLGPGGRIFAVPFDGAPGEPRVLFQAVDATSFEPHPDGTRFLLHVAERAGEPEVQLMINWTALLDTPRR
jgi:eukaryotic-like serine/threonine-protein kinase